MSREDVLERMRQLQTAIDAEPGELETQNSAESARSAGQQGLAYLPYLTFHDILLLRGEGISNLETLENRLLQVPAPTWPHVVDLVRAGVIHVNRSDVAQAASATHAGSGNGSDGDPRCLALTKSGTRCRNPPREDSQYCSSHKGYQPTEAELEARRRGLLARA